MIEINKGDEHKILGDIEPDIFKKYPV